MPSTSRVQASTRPEYYHRVPEGCRPVAVVDTHWLLDHPSVGRTCRAGIPGPRCPNVSVAVLMRPIYRSRSPKQPWAYCADHMYGRWIEDGRVLWWELECEDDS